MRRTVSTFKLYSETHIIEMKFIIGGFALYFLFSLICISRGKKYILKIGEHVKVADNNLDEFGLDYADDSKESVEDQKD